LEGVATVNLKLLPDKYYVSPFLTAGIGASKYKGYYGAFMPFGIGAQVKVVDEIFIMFNSQYRVPVTENTSYHFYHSIGVVANLFKKKEPLVVVVPIPVVEPPKDRDGDGVLDVDDKCPDVAGLASLQGCPDRDGDGIADADDKCPDVAGLARYQGCPIPDTDKDGINDEVDKCPTVPGLARYQGCPIPDTDGDGVNDEEDKCINEKGPASNFGCPIINEEIIKKVNRAAQNIFFETAKSKLLAKSFPKLNEVVTILNENPTYKVQIDGHTDSQGKDEYNQGLSDERAASVKAYLVSKGIAESRLSSTGYGETKPVADNNTAAGRAKNRRVEMTLSNY
jgi:outer membrane protein OmpA-like peptidoglycan-associated protein